MPNMLFTQDNSDVIKHTLNVMHNLTVKSNAHGARTAYLFSLALALKSSITFRNSVTVKSPPSASSAIILHKLNAQW